MQILLLVSLTTTAKSAPGKLMKLVKTFLPEHPSIVPAIILLDQPCEDNFVDKTERTQRSIPMKSTVTSPDGAFRNALWAELKISK